MPAKREQMVSVRQIKVVTAWAMSLAMVVLSSCRIVTTSWATCLAMAVMSSCHFDAFDESLNFIGESCCNVFDELYEAELVRWMFETLRDIFISWSP